MYIFSILLQVHCCLGYFLLLPVESVIPHPANNVDVDELVRHYFSLDFIVSDRCEFFLFIHHVAVSTRTIKRILKKNLG